MMRPAKPFRLSVLRACAAPLGLLLLLSGCISLTKAPPPSLLVLTADRAPVAGAARQGAAGDALLVEVPETGAKLATVRVPVTVDDSNIAYLKDTQWVDKPASLFQQLLAETLAAPGSRLVLTDYEAAGRAGVRLSGTLVEFGLDARTMEAVVIYDAARLARDEPVAKRRFEVRIPVAKAEGGPVGAALNEAANRVAADVAAWLSL